MYTEITLGKVIGNISIELSINVTKKLKKEKRYFGCFAINNICLGDNIEYYINCDFKQFHKDHYQELNNFEIKTDIVYKELKKLIKRGQKLNII